MFGSYVPFSYRPEELQRNQYNKEKQQHDAITKMVWENFGLKPEDEEQIYEYRQPYLELFDKGLVGLGHTIPGALMVGLACTELSGWCVCCVWLPDGVWR
jgi:hypothetical protein